METSNPHGTLPDWRDPGSGGTWIRVGLWLATTVGPGGVFTKQDLRTAFPGVEQVDRRMRDLRKWGWIIDENRQDVSLRLKELRLVKIGVRVWDDAERKASKRSAISNRVRQEVFSRDDHRCVRCGVAAGELFDDEPGVRARMTVAHVYPDSLAHDAAREQDLVTACQRCNEALRQHTPNYLDADQVWERVREAGRAAKVRLLEWMEAGRRPQSSEDVIFARWLQLPGLQRQDVLERLRQQVRGPEA